MFYFFYVAANTRQMVDEKWKSNFLKFQFPIDNFIPPTMTKGTGSQIILQLTEGDHLYTYL